MLEQQQPLNKWCDDKFLFFLLLFDELKGHLEMCPQMKRTVICTYFHDSDADLNSLVKSDFTFTSIQNK